MLLANYTRNIPKLSTNILLTILLCIFLGETSVHAHAQNKAKFTIASFEEDPFDLSARNPEYEKFDGSGDRYAIIKVSSNNPTDDLTSYTFNFGYMKHIVEMHDGVLWIYVQRNAKHVSISREGYIPINRYDLHTTIESGKTYVMMISAEGKRISLQMVQFKVEPPNANYSITIKRNSPNSTTELFGTTNNEGIAAKSLELGTYSYEVLSENHHKQEGRFTLTDQTKTHVEHVTLRPNYGNITLKVNSNSEIFINGERKGVRQWSGKLKSGTYLVECREVNHKSSSQYITVIENTTEEIILNAPEAILGTFAITSDPSDAHIIVDGKDYGTTPRNLELPIGKHRITLTKDGHSSVTQDIEIEEIKAESAHIVLSNKLWVKLFTKPANAILRIDGIEQSGEDFHLATGYHNIEIYTSDDKYVPIKKNLNIDGSHNSYSFHLKKRLIRKSDIYTAVGFDLGHPTSASATIGGHIKNFNIEASFGYCLTVKETIWWHDNEPDYSGNYSEPIREELKPILILSLKAGYGIPVGARFKLTPQIGYRHMLIQDEDGDGWGNRTNSYCISATLGIRTYFAFSSHFGISLTPEYAFRLKQGNAIQSLSLISSKLNRLGNGFNANLSFVVSF